MEGNELLMTGGKRDTEWHESFTMALREILRRCLMQLTTQNIDRLHEEIASYILGNTICIEEFDRNHPEAQFVIHEIKHVFEVFVIPELKKIKDWASYKYQNIFIGQVHTQIVLRLFERLGNYTLGLDSGFITALSGSVHESEETSGHTIALIPSSACLENDAEAIIFDEFSRTTLEIQNVSTIRKQLNMAKTGALAICKEAKTSRYITIGVLPESRRKDFLRFEFPKRLEWLFCVPDQIIGDNESSFTIDGCRLRYYNGTLMFPKLNLKHEIRSAIESLNVDENMVDSAAQIALAAYECNHGSILIVSSKEVIEDENKRLVSTGKRGICLVPPVQLINKNVTSPAMERLTSIDGALLVDLAGFCYACGVILDGKVCREGTHRRGARYNSTRTYIRGLAADAKKKYPNASVLGIVKSEDGMLDIFDGCCKICGENILDCPIC